MIADNSEEAYMKAFNTKRLDVLRYRVFVVIRDNPGVTDEQIASLVGSPINSVTGRVGELFKADLIEFDNTRNQRNNTCRRSFVKGYAEATA